MPEGHTIHRLARDHRRWLRSKTVRVTSPQGRFADGARAIDGDTITTVDAWGKHLFYSFAQDPRRLHIHLGLFGRFRQHTRPASPPRTPPRMVMTSDKRELRLSGPTACELLDEEGCARIFARLGPDPLRRDADADAFVRKAQRSRRAIGALLLDQSVIAGIGNVYRSELCFLVSVHPATPARELSAYTLAELWERGEQLLKVGVRLNRIVTVNPRERDRSRHRELRRHERTYVYGRSRCLRCDGDIDVMEIGARTAYACSHCQGRPE